MGVLSGVELVTGYPNVVIDKCSSEVLRALSATEAHFVQLSRESKSFLGGRNWKQGYERTANPRAELFM